MESFQKEFDKKRRKSLEKDQIKKLVEKGTRKQKELQYEEAERHYNSAVEKYKRVLKIVGKKRGKDSLEYAEALQKIEQAKDLLKKRKKEEKDTCTIQ